MASIFLRPLPQASLRSTAYSSARQPDKKPGSYGRSWFSSNPCSCCTSASGKPRPAHTSTSSWWSWREPHAGCQRVLVTVRVICTLLPFASLPQ